MSYLGLPKRGPGRWYGSASMARLDDSYVAHRTPAAVEGIYFLQVIYFFPTKLSDELVDSLFKPYHMFSVHGFEVNAIWHGIYAGANMQLKFSVPISKSCHSVPVYYCC